MKCWALEWRQRQPASKRGGKGEWTSSWTVESHLKGRRRFIDRRNDSCEIYSHSSACERDRFVIKCGLIHSFHLLGTLSHVSNVVSIARQAAKLTNDRSNDKWLLFWLISASCLPTTLFSGAFIILLTDECRMSHSHFSEFISENLSTVVHQDSRDAIIKREQTDDDFRLTLRERHSVCENVECVVVKRLSFSSSDSPSYTHIAFSAPLGNYDNLITKFMSNGHTTQNVCH